MQQLNAVQTTAFAQNFHQLQYLVRRQAELGFFTTGGLPFTGTLRGQTRTHAQTRDHIQPFGFIQHDRDFRHLLDDQVDLVAHLLANQRQTNVFTIFITITNNHAAGHASMRQNCHQFGLRTGFQSQRLTGVNQRFNHATVLVNLDRVNEEIITLVAVGFTGALERGVNRTQTVLQDLREAEQRRQTLPLRFASFYQLGKINTCFRDVRVRAHANVTEFVDVIVVITPPGNIVGTQHLAGFLGTHCNLLHGA